MGVGCKASEANFNMGEGIAICTYKHICMHIHMYECTFMYMLINTHSCMHTHVCMQKKQNKYIHVIEWGLYCKSQNQEVLKENSSFSPLFLIRQIYDSFTYIAKNAA